MKKQTISICISIFFITIIFLPIISSSNVLINADTDIKINNNTGGWIEEINGVTVLHVKGSYYEMGFQHGSLLKEKCLQVLRAFIYNAEKFGITYEDLVKFWNIKKEFMPQDYIDEIQGLADGLDLSFEYVSAGHLSGGYTALDKRVFSIECCNFVCRNSATADGKMYHGRSYDLPIWSKDPETGVLVIQENQIIVIREPDEGHASIGIGIAGYVGALGGFNEEGVVIGSAGSKSSDETRSGTPIGDILKSVLDHSSTAEEAIGFITENRSYGYNYVISDKNVSYVIEISANQTYIGTWNDPVESLHPFWEIDNVVRRVNLYLNKSLAYTQREKYNPKAFFAWLLGKNDYFPIWRHYRALSIGIERHWGKLNSNSMMNILRNTYNGRIDFLFFIATNTRILETWHQWVVCPETGDMWFNLAGNGKSSFKNPTHHVNLFNFLK